MIQGLPAPPGFDPNFALGQIAPIVGIVVVVGALALAARWVFGSAVGDALAERIRQGSRRRRHWKGFGGEWTDTPTEGLADADHVAELEQRVVDMQGQIAEMAERLDFAERLLAQKRERSLPGA